MNLFKDFCGMKQRELCIFFCVETRVLAVVSNDLLVLCEFRMENHEYFITNHLIPLTSVFLENEQVSSYSRNSPAFYVNWYFITEFIRSRQKSLFWPGSI